MTITFKALLECLLLLLLLLQTSFVCMLLRQTNRQEFGDCWKSGDVTAFRRDRDDGPNPRCAELSSIKFIQNTSADHDKLVFIFKSSSA